MYAAYIEEYRNVVFLKADTPGQNMLLKRFTPHYYLRPFVSSIWCFESDRGIPLEDMRVVVPNGQVKLVIPYKNGLTSQIDGQYTLAPDTSLTLIGLADKPAVINAQTEREIGTIGIEFHTAGAYRFLHLRFGDIVNQVHPASDVLGKEGAHLQRRISEAGTTEERIAIVERFLLERLSQQREDSIVDYCVKQITASNGRMNIEELARKTGYTRRYLNMKFDEKVGLNLKTLSSIYRFQHFYKLWAMRQERHFFDNEFYDYYYDQSHFIKDFKRFTNFSPTRFANMQNEFGRIFYKD